MVDELACEKTAVCLATRRAARHRKIDRQKRRYVWLSICSMVFNLKRDVILRSTLASRNSLCLSSRRRKRPAVSIFDSDQSTDQPRFLLLNPSAPQNVRWPDEICACAQRYRCNNCVQRSDQSSKLSVVCDIQRWDGRRRHKLRLHNISTVHGDRAWARQFLPTEHAIPATTRTSPL